MLPGERPIGADAQAVAEFFRREADKISRLASKLAVEGLGLSGLGVRRRIRATYLEQIEEAARLFELYGDDAPRLFGESQRRQAAVRLSQGLHLSEAIEETAVLAQAALDAWGRKYGPLPTGIARLLLALFGASAAQTSDVFLTFQRSESAAFQEAALLQTLVRHLNEAIFLVERDGTISYVSPVLESITDYPIQLIVGASIFEEIEFLADVRDPHGNRIPWEEMPGPLAFQSGERQHREAVFSKRKDGSDSVLEIDAVPIFDDEGQLRGVVVTIRDRTVTFRKQLELEAAYRELRRMHARLLSRTRLEAVGGLAQSTAHALNNQLNVIALRLKKLEGIPEASPERQGIERSVREIAALVSRLQELASAPQHRKPSTTDVNSVVDDALGLARSELEAAQVNLEYRRGILSAAKGERETLLEFMTALLLGKTDVLPEGGTIEIETSMAGPRIVIRILDRAPTFTPAEISQLFEPLAPGAASRILSLSAGHHAVERWGGSVQVLPREGGGNVFEIELPIASEFLAPRREEVPTPAPSKGAERVLVVDDDVDNAEMLSDLVVGAGSQAFTALSGRSALETAAKALPDAALIDLILPDMNGWDVARKLKEAFPDLRVAVVSGLAVGREERQVGVADEVFRKPIDAEEVLHFLGL